MVQSYIHGVTFDGVNSNMYGSYGYYMVHTWSCDGVTCVFDMLWYEWYE